MKFLQLAIFVSLLSPLSQSFANRPAGKQGPESSPKGKESQLIKPESVAGCYELGVLKWQPDLHLGEDAVFITPPQRIQILAERGTRGFESNGYLVRPAPGVAPSIHRMSYWEPTGAKTIRVAWTTGFSGLTMQLSVEGNTLKGKAETFWDFTRARQTARISAPKIDCANKK